jgi:signal transduction histidine kinase
MLLYTFESNRRQARFEEARAILENVFRQHESDLANEMFSAKRLALRQSLDEMMRFKGVCAATIYDGEGRMVLATDPTLQPPLPPEERAVLDRNATFEHTLTPGRTLAHYSNKIEVMGTHVGYIDVYYDLSGIEEESRMTLVLFFSSITGLLLCMSLLLNSLLDHSMIRPVRRLAEAMRSVGEGDVGRTVKAEGDDEIGQMTEAFNAMSTDLRLAAMAKDDNARQLEEINRQLSLKAAELARANTRLRELDRMKSAFLSSVSHELRTPLTSVRGFSKLIHKDYRTVCAALNACDDKTRRKIERIETNLEIIEKESERLTVMVNDVLDLSRIEEGRAQWRDVLLDTRAFLLETARTAQGFLAETPEVAFATDLPDNLPPVMADPDRLHQVLVNLLSNAAKFTLRGEVRLLAEARGDMVRMGVRDTGVGVPEGEWQKIFDKFHQAAKGDQIENKPKGTGLGLAISRNIVAHYGGRIWAEPAPGGGSMFLFELPAAQSLPAAEADD